MGEGDKIEASLEDDTLPLTDIVDPRDTDVLCGRGGAALRHPGNQTYRRLVHLNKGLYITCLKAEKLKISRSIVAAIREQNGRFLERDTKKGTWLDIGDKKAMEKTSQALREGQPKLRQKIVELGGGAAGAAALLETQFPGGSMYQISQATANANNAAAAVAAVAVQQQQQQQQVQAQQQQVQAQLSGATPRDTLSSDMLQRLSLTETTIAEEPFGSSSHLRASLTPAGSASSFGIERSNFSLMSDISSCGIAESALSLDTNGYRSIMSNGSDRMPPPAMTPGSLATSLAGSLASAESMSSLNKKSSATSTGPNSTTTTTTTTSSTMPYGLDRRKYFARMKYSRPASGRFGSSSSNQKGSASQRSLGTGGTGSDGMPDIHLVESSPSLFSGMSGGSNSDKKMDMVPDVANVFESRRSIMSGLSRISDTSEVNSIFSDLSKKIGNVSTRSIAMSEISDMDGRDESHFDHIHHTTTTATTTTTTNNSNNNNNNNNDHHHHHHKLPTVTTSMNHHHHLQMEE